MSKINSKYHRTTNYIPLDRELKTILVIINKLLKKGFHWRLEINIIKFKIADWNIL